MSATELLVNPQGPSQTSPLPGSACSMLPEHLFLVRACTLCIPAVSVLKCPSHQNLLPRKQALLGTFLALTLHSRRSAPGEGTYLTCRKRSTDSRPPAGPGMECTASFLLPHNQSDQKRPKAVQDGEGGRDVRYLHTHCHLTTLRVMRWFSIGGGRGRGKRGHNSAPGDTGQCLGHSWLSHREMLLASSGQSLARNAQASPAASSSRERTIWAKMSTVLLLGSPERM